MLGGSPPGKVEIKVAGSMKKKDERGSPRNKIGKKKKKNFFEP